MSDREDARLVCEITHHDWQEDLDGYYCSQCGEYMPYATREEEMEHREKYDLQNPNRCRATPEACGEEPKALAGATEPVTAESIRWTKYYEVVGLPAEYLSKKLSTLRKARKQLRKAMTHFVGDDRNPIAAALAKLDAEILITEKSGMAPWIAPCAVSPCPPPYEITCTDPIGNKLST